MLCIDLFCGLGGWTEGFLAEGYDVIGFDIEIRPYPGQLVIQDVLTLHGAQFKHATCIVASPPCQAYSYRAMPWKRAKALGPPDNSLFDACFRIQREACEAAGRHIPMVVENVCGAQKWVGKAAWHYGSYYLWGDVPALMPFTVTRKLNGRSLNAGAGKWRPANGLGIEESDQITKNTGGSWFNVAHNTTSGCGNNPDGRKMPNGSPNEGIKHHGSGPIWFNTGQSLLPSKSNARKQASALIAKIPLPLARHIARVYATQPVVR